MSLTQGWLKIKNEIWWVLVTTLTGGAVIGAFFSLNQSEPVSPLQVKNVPNLPTTLPSRIGDESSHHFVASKNGTKYYLPTCAGAKRIKEENKIWFNTVAEAKTRGLTPAANCPGLPE